MNQPKGSKKKLTLIATEEGVEKAKNTLIRLGFESQTNFAEVILMSRTTISKFFNRKPIQLDSFKKICKELGGLKWQEIAGISEAKQLETTTARGVSSSSVEEIESSSTSQRRVTVIDQQTETKKAVITLQGDIESVTNLKILQAILREHSGNTIEIQDIQPGSIKISLEGSPEDIEKLITAIKSGELKQLDDFPIEDIIKLNEEVATEDNNDKWQLVKKIRDREIKELNFPEIDLSDTDLSFANLIGANLIGANLSGANLIDANLIDANLSSAYLIDADLSGAYLIGANLSRANLIDANLIDANLSSAYLIDADLSGAYLIDANLSRANLSGANLSRANLSGANLSSANLSRANLRSSKIDNKTQLDSKWHIVWELVNKPHPNRDLSDRDLSYAYLNNVELSNSRLVKANLESSNLSNSNLSQANLIGANLRNAILLSANLTDADLSGADVTKARFGYNQGISESLKQDLIARDAIFEDSPGDRSKVLTPV